MQNLIHKIEGFGLQPNLIAEKSGINLDKIAAILKGQTEPTLSEIRRIAKALRVAPDLLINEEKEIPELKVLFRKNFTENDKPKVGRLSHVINNALLLLDSYEANNNAFSKFPQVANTYDGAKQLAEIFRTEFFGLDFVSPILNLPDIIANELNCILLVSDLGQGADGASVIFNDIPFIVISPRFEPRMLFTLAHELGHILAHHNEHSFAIIDSDDISIRKRKYNEEAFAHAFASELLMPQEGVGLTLKTIRRVLKIDGDYIGEVELLYLSRFYGVSFEAAAVRFENLGLVPVGTAASLYESIKKEFKSPEIRAQQLGIPERQKIHFTKVSPNLYRPAIQKIRSGEISLEKASELLSVSAVDIINYNSESEWI